MNEQVEEKPKSTAKAPVVVEDMAEREFQKFGDMMDLDFDPSKLDEEDKAGFVEARRIFIREVMAGALVINEDGEPVFTPQRSDDVSPLTFHEPTGAELQSMDKVKKSADVAKTFTVLTGITKCGSNKRFALMKLRDLNVCIAVMNLFMG